MTTPDLPPLPEPFVPLYGDERRKWADQMRDYAAAAVLAEQKKSEAIEASYKSSYEMAVARGVLAKKFMTTSAAMRFETEWAAARAAIRSEQEQQP